MTLNITVVTNRRIFQSADYRLTTASGGCEDFRTRKILLIARWHWYATVCFSGVGRTETTDMSVWLAERIDEIGPRDPFERLLDQLVSAETVLSTVADKRHSFSVGAFVNYSPLFVLVSNFERPGYKQVSTATSGFSVYERQPPFVMVSGQRALSRADQRHLLNLARRATETDEIFLELAAANRKAAVSNKYISPECFTTQLTSTGTASGRSHGIEYETFRPELLLPVEIRRALGFDA